MFEVLEDLRQEGWNWCLSYEPNFKYQIRIWKPVTQFVKNGPKFVVKSACCDDMQDAMRSLLGKLESL